MAMGHPCFKPFQHEMFAFGNPRNEKLYDVILR